MKINIIVIGFLFLGATIVATDITYGVPYVFIWLFLLLFGFFGIMSLNFRHSDFQRLLNAPSLSFSLKSGILCVSDDLTVGFHRIELKPEKFTVTLSLDSIGECITGMHISSDQQAPLPQMALCIHVYYGLVIVVDSAILSDPDFRKRLADLISSRLPSPVFHAIEKDGEVIGFIVEPADGNNDYQLRSQNGGLFCSFQLPEEDRVP